MYSHALENSDYAYGKLKNAVGVCEFELYHQQRNLLAYYLL